MKAEEFKNQDGENCRCVYEPVKHVWFSHSMDRPFKVTHEYGFLSEALMAGMRADWLPLHGLVERIR